MDEFKEHLARALAREVDWISEFTYEVRLAAAAHLRRANRSLRAGLHDADDELRALAEETADLARGAVRARADRMRSSH